MTRAQQITALLKLIERPPFEQKVWRKRIEWVLTQDRVRDDLEEAGTKDGRRKLSAYIKALRKVLDRRDALHAEIRWLVLDRSAVEAEIAAAEALAKMIPPRKRRRPRDQRTKHAVFSAAVLLMQAGLELTKERKGKWHLASQVIAEKTDSDLRKHLDDYDDVFGRN